MNFIDTLPFYMVIAIGASVLVLVWMFIESRKDDNSIDDIMDRKD